MSNDFAIHKLKRDYIAGQGNLKALAAKHGVSYPTARRRCKAENWGADKLATQAAADTIQGAIAHRISQHDPIDQIGLLEAAIADVKEWGLMAPVKSKEGAISALVKLLDAYRARRPETIEDIIKRCVELDIQPQDFIRKLEEAWRQQPRFR